MATYTTHDEYQTQQIDEAQEDTKKKADEISTRVVTV